MSPVDLPLRHPLPFPWRRGFVPTIAGALTVFAGGLSVRPPEPLRRLHDAAFGWAYPRVCRVSHETSAISTLGTIASSQDWFVAARAVDEDGDGVGEYGGFLELSSAAPLRGRGRTLTSPVLPGAFRTVLPGGTASRGGYLFRMALPARDGVPIADAPRVGFPDGTIDPDAAERRFVCYAWPAGADAKSTRTFVVTQDGAIWATRNPAYAGAAAPLPGAAMQSGGLQSLTGEPAEGRPAQDGSVWTKVN